MGNVSTGRVLSVLLWQARTHLVTAKTEREGDVVGHAKKLSERHAVLAVDAEPLHQGDRVLDAGLVVRGHHHFGAIAPSHVLEYQGHGRVIASVGLFDRLSVEECGWAERDAGRGGRCIHLLLALERGLGIEDEEGGESVSIFCVVWKKYKKGIGGGRMFEEGARSINRNQVDSAL